MCCERADLGPQGMEFTSPLPLQLRSLPTFHTHVQRQVGALV